jgi:proteasome lid subunit RPN8/RPN11
VKAFPDECCGFFFGEEEGEQRIITEVLPVFNSKAGDKRRRFEIVSKDYLEAEQFAEQNRLQLLGVYHSHPNHPAIPSEHDRVAAQPYFSYVILSVIVGELSNLRSWQLNDQLQFEEEKIFKLKLINQ